MIFLLPLLYYWSQGSQSWCLKCVQSESHANVWRGWASLFPVHCPTHPVSEHPTEWTCPSPHYQVPLLAGPGTAEKNTKNKQGLRKWTDQQGGKTTRKQHRLHSSSTNLLVIWHLTNENLCNLMRLITVIVHLLLSENCDVGSNSVRKKRRNI